MSWELWTKSGRIDAYRYDVLPLTSVNAKRTKTITDNVTSCTLNFDWEKQSRVGGQLTFDGCPPIDNCYVRIFYTPTIGNTKKSIELGTFYAFTQDARYEMGRWTGTTTLESVLTRYTRDCLYKNWALNANTSAIAAFKKAMNDFGGSYLISGVKDVKFSKTVVVPFGESVFTLLARIAKTLGCALNCDTHGRVILEPIKYASTRPLSGELPTGNRSVTFDGIDYSCTWQTTPNRYATHFEWDTHSFYIEPKSSGGTIQFYDAPGGNKTKTGTARSRVSTDTTYKGKQWGYVPGAKAWVNVEDCTRVKDSKSTPQVTTTHHLFGKAVTASSATNHPNRIGRYITRCEELEKMSPLTQAQIDKVTKNGLKEATQVSAPTYTFQCLYLPLLLNRVYWFKQGGVKIDGIVRAIDMELGEDLVMRVTIRKVRNHG